MVMTHTWERLVVQLYDISIVTYLLNLLDCSFFPFFVCFMSRCPIMQQVGMVQVALKS